MKKNISLEHEFVEFIPSELANNKLYISIPFATAAHKCCCGCGQEVITPLSPTDWVLIFDGQTVSLNPSIGNWSFSCKSHYWVKANRIYWAESWSKEQIERGRSSDRERKEKQYLNDDSNIGSRQVSHYEEQKSKTRKKQEGAWAVFCSWFKK